MKKILIAGEGGQGVQSLSKILLDILNTKDFQISFVPNYGVEQRGGVSMGYIQFGNEIIYYPKFLKADIMIILSERALKRSHEYINKDSIVIYNADLITNPEIKKIKGSHGFKFDTLSEQVGSGRVMNMIVLGCIMKTIKEFMGIDDVKQIINHKFEDKYVKNPNLKVMNEKALELGYNLIK